MDGSGEGEVGPPAHRLVVGMTGEAVRTERDHRVGAYVVEDRCDPIRRLVRVDVRTATVRVVQPVVLLDAQDAQRRLELSRPDLGRAVDLRGPNLDTPASPRVAVTQTTRCPASVSSGRQPADEVGLVIGVRPDHQHGAEVVHVPMVIRSVLSRRCHGTVRAMAGRWQPAPRIVVIDGANRAPHERKQHSMTTQLDAPVLDFGKLEEFAGKVAADQAAAYNAILVYLGDRLGLWRALASLETATAAELAERSGITPRYVQEWLAAQAANGYVTYDAATDVLHARRPRPPPCSPRRRARPP